MRIRGWRYSIMSQTSDMIDRAAKIVGESWAVFLAKQFTTDRMKKLARFVKQQRQTVTVYPEPERVFRVFREIPYSAVSVVIIGQDPYYNGQADGLAFSSKKDSTPPSLMNIFKEIERDTGVMPYFHSPDLTRWADQGVFLINSALTVMKGHPGSHAGIGWEKFVGEAVHAISIGCVPTVFMLWGNKAQKFKYYIEPQNHLILEASHPSPRSADISFNGCGHFSKCNDFFKSHDLKPIDWR